MVDTVLSDLALSESYFKTLNLNVVDAQFSLHWVWPELFLRGLHSENQSSHRHMDSEVAVGTIRTNPTESATASCLPEFPDQRGAAELSGDQA